MKSRFHVMLLTMLAGWINRHRQDMIEYLKEENRILREKLGRKRLLLNDDQRRRLAVLGKKLGRKALDNVTEIFSPETILNGTGCLLPANMMALPIALLAGPRFQLN